MRLLLITEPSLVGEVQPTLERDGLMVEAVDDLEKGDFKVQTRCYEAVLLDQRQGRTATLPTILRWRRDGLTARLLVLLPRNASSSDRAAYLDAGADACVNHPLGISELRAHLRVLRRREFSPPGHVRRVHDLEINTAVRTVRRGGQPIHLTPREFDLLHLLITHSGKVLSRSMIMEHLYDDRAGSYSNVVDVYIRYLRGKIDKGFEKPLILTRWGQGYLLRAEGA